MEDAKVQTGTTGYETLFGGIPLTVHVADHTARTISAEVVRVRQLPIAAYQAAFASHEDEQAMVALYLDQPIEFVKRLAPESYTRCAEEGRRMNVDFFAYCTRRLGQQMEAIRRVDPSLVEKITNRVALNSRG